mgnify:CR=1 FL=1
MYDGEEQPESTVSPPIRRQYTAGSSVRHRSGGTARRLVFFGLASLWGFIVGIVGLLAAIGVEGQRLASDAGVVPALIPALLLAGVGGVVMAAAYRESKRRAH